MMTFITHTKRLLVFTGSLFFWGHGCQPAGSRATPMNVAVIADCQYCECPYSVRWDNDYIQGKKRLQEAVDTLNKLSIDVGFHLGDFIDRNRSSYDTLLPILQNASFPMHHVLGNHDFNVDASQKEGILPLLGLNRGYYSLVKNNYRFIVLDGTEISTYRYTDTVRSNAAKQLMDTYRQKNRKQAQPWNGCLSDDQLAWLKIELDNCRTQQQHAIIMCHFPVRPKSEVNLWNDTEVVALITQYPEVKLFINGHHHPGNFEIYKGIPFVTLQAMVRSERTNSFAYLSLYEDHIALHGFGREPQRIFRFTP